MASSPTRVTSVSSTDWTSGNAASSSAGWSSRRPTLARNAVSAMRWRAVLRLERQLGQGVATASQPARAAPTRLRAESAPDSACSSAWAGVEPQQLQSGMSVSFTPSAAQAARVERSYSREVPSPEQPG